MRESIKLDNGKYEVVLDSGEGTFEFEALRYGNEWRNLTGDNLMLAMFFKIQELKEEIQQFKDVMEHIEIYDLIKSRSENNDDDIKYKLEDLMKERD